MLPLPFIVSICILCAFMLPIALLKYVLFSKMPLVITTGAVRALSSVYVFCEALMHSLLEVQLAGDHWEAKAGDLEAHLHCLEKCPAAPTAAENATPNSRLRVWLKEAMRWRARQRWRHCGRLRKQLFFC